jgi:hypothetical protein
MKKFIVFAVVLALLVPSLVMAAMEISLGGFIKMDAMWDSDNGVGKNVYAPPARNNSADAKHGRMKFTASGTRFSFTIKGPDLWGAKTSGFIEMDFDLAERELLGTGFTASKSYVPRLRHAMFRFNWPTSELLFGQYWPMFCDWWPEVAEDGPTQMTGTPTHRLAQVRFTQTFMSDWTVAALIGDPTQTYLGASNTVPSLYNANINNGQSAESPRVEGKIRYAHDFWGKAAYYGQPTPFTIQFAAGWQRNVMRASAFTATAFGEGNSSPSGTINVKNQYLNPWLAMGSVFIPVIPTQSANLAGTASILTQLWIGQGIEAFGFTGVGSNKYRFNNNFFGQLNYEADLLQKFGGFVQGQYYFTNQWFINALYAFSKAYNVSRSQFQRGNAIGLGGMEMAFTGDNASTIQQAEATLWYRPIQAIKFGLQYAYTAASYSQVNTVPGATSNSSRFGDDHRVEFVGFFYF